jgi:hypothetical protein
MKKLTLLSLLLFVSSLFVCMRAFPQTITEMTLETNQTATGQKQFSPGSQHGPVTFANLTITPSQSNGTLVYVSDASASNPCVGGGSGAFALRVNGGWNCSSGIVSSYTVATLPGSPATGTLAQVTDAFTQGSCTSGGGSKLALCRWTGSAWSAIGDGGAGSSGVLPGNTWLAATNFGVKADTQWVWNATITNGQNTISCASNNCNFTNADDGKICFATNLSPTGFGTFKTATVKLPQGTFTHTGAQTGTCSGGNATATLTNTAVFVWGSDDTTALNTAWTAAKASCATLLLPGTNPNANGPGVMLVQSASLNANSATNCISLQQAGGSRAGLGIRGVDINATFIVPTPNFDFTSCGNFAGGGVSSCFLSVWDGINISDLSIWGAGNSNPAAGQTAKAIVAALPANNATIKRLSITGWGANGTNGIGFGLLFGGNELKLDSVNVDGAGITPCVARPTSSSQNAVSAFALTCWDGSLEGLWVDGNSLSNREPFSCFGCNFGNDSGTSGCIVGITGGGAFYDYGSSIGGVNSASDGNGVCVGYAQGGAQTGAGTATFFGSNFSEALGSGGSQIYLNASGNTASFVNTRFAGSVTGGGSAMLKANAAGSYFVDVGGSTFSTTGTKFTGSGAIFGQASITGTIITAAKAVLSAGWGNTAAWTGLGGTNSFTGTITASGTGQGANPTITYTFPTAYLTTPQFCNAIQIGGTQAVGTFSSASLSSTGVTFTYSGTPGAGNTIIVQVTCQN